MQQALTLFSILLGLFSASALADLNTQEDFQNHLDTKCFEDTPKTLSLCFQNNVVRIVYHGHLLEGYYRIEKRPKFRGYVKHTLVFDSLFDQSPEPINPFLKIDLTETFPRFILSLDKSEVSRILWQTGIRSLRFELLPLSRNSTGET